MDGETIDVTILSAFEAGTFWTGSIDSKNFEKSLRTTLARGEKYPTIPRDAIRALAAAEGVAIAEGRGPVTSDERMNGYVASIAAKLAEEADPVSEKTIALAERAVRAITDAGVCEQTRFASDEGRALFRADVEGLAKRLKVALASRATRARAPNAVPLSPLRVAHHRPINWRTFWLHLMLDDALALLDALRATGATPLVLMQDLTFHELNGDWEERGWLSELRDSPFDERAGEWTALQRGRRVLVWWPDVSPRPVAETTDAGWTISGWGHGELELLGSTPTHVLRSTWSYPTGKELKDQKFAGGGPWHDVDWKTLRRKTTEVMRLVTGPLGGVAPLDLTDTWTLPTAAAAARSGARSVAGKWFHSTATLPD